MPGVNGAGINGDFDAGFDAEYGNGKGYDYPPSERRVYQDIPYKETVEEMDIKAQERIAEKNLELDRDKFEFLKTQAGSPAGGYPSLATEQDKPDSPISMPILLLIGLFFFIRRKR